MGKTTRRAVLKLLTATSGAILLPAGLLGQRTAAPTNEDYWAAFDRLHAAHQAPEFDWRGIDPATRRAICDAEDKAIRPRDAALIATGQYWPFQTLADLDRWLASL